MATRFSFEDDDDRSYLPQTSGVQAPHQPTRGTAGYQVSSGAAYIPPREPSRSPSPPALHDQYYQSYSGPPQPQQTLLDSSPSRHPAAAPAPPAHRDPYATNAPLPPPHVQRATGSTDSFGRPLAAAGLVTGAAAAGVGALTASNIDTGYHGAAAASPYHSRDRSDPFRDGSESDSLHAPGHGGFPIYPTSAQDPFASRTNSYQDVTPLASSESYEMRPTSLNKNMSFDTYGHGWHENERDLGDINPHDIADDDEEALSNTKGRKKKGAAAGATGFMGAIGRDASGNYGAVPGGDAEKSTWLQKQSAGNKRWKWYVGGLIGTFVLLAIIGGVIGGVLVSKKGGTSSPANDPDKGKDLDKDSPSVKALLNNKNLHKIFPGVDYTPFNAALYPECETNKPDQANVTKDVAVLSQLTNAIRLYGTDCNQTEMVLHALDKLDLKDSMKIWLGVYVWNNQTTNDRQLSKMWNLLDQHGADPFAGVIVGNEVLLNGLTGFGDTELAKLLDDVRSNMTAHGWKLSVSTSDAGVSFKKSPASTKATDIIMANVHPFFAGVPIDEAAGWTWTYTQNNDAGLGKEALVAETGWPSGGGNLCTNDAGLNTTCASKTAGAVASVDNVNKFLESWPCQALNNGTRYFMFEAFDEQWKERYNYPGAEWETQWGLMDTSRTLKSGIKIPDCGGKTV